MNGTGPGAKWGNGNCPETWSKRRAGLMPRMSTVTRYPAQTDDVMAASVSATPLTRPGEPPWAKLLGVVAGILLLMGAYILWIAPQSNQPLPTKVFEGKVGRTGLVLTVTPLQAGHPRQSLTMDLTDPATKKPATFVSVAVRLVPPEGVKDPGGPAGPLKAKQTPTGQYVVKIPKAQRVMAPGDWKLRVSAVSAPGQASKKTIPLTYAAG